MAASTARRTSSLTRGDSLTTRETVARETPATRATASRVAVPSTPLWPFDPSVCATEPPSGVRALSRVYWAQYAHLSRERSHEKVSRLSERSVAPISLPTSLPAEACRGERDDRHAPARENGQRGVSAEQGID